MYFKEAMETIKAVMSSNDVPVVVGEAGIGKTAMMQKIANDNNMKLFTIDCTTLKEGEAAGLPYVDGVVNNNVLKNKIYHILNDDEMTAKQYTLRIMKEIENTSERKLSYAPHHTLREIQDIIRNDENQKVILFLDELNRSEHVVQQELMNIILQRNINGFIVPDNVYIVCAMNPSSKMENFKDSNYQIVDLDKAQNDRLVWIEMDSDIKEWIEWGTQEKDYHFDVIGLDHALEFTDTTIHTDIMEYLSTYPENLNITEETTEDIVPSPRSWERVSKAYYLYKMGMMERNILFNIIKGNIGMHVGLEFFNFTESKTNPIMTPEEVFAKENLLENENDELGETLTNMVESESPARLLVLNSRLLKYMEDMRGINKPIYHTYIKLIHAYPVDLINTIYHDIYNRTKLNDKNEERKSKMFDNLCKFSTFVSGYTAMDNKIMKLAQLRADEV